MDIDQLLKSKSPKEKMDFLNSIRCKVTTYNKTAIIPLDYSKGSKGL